MNEWHVGQEVLIFSSYRGRGPEPGVVTKVGRKWLTVEREGEWKNPTQYSIEEGRENSNIGSPGRIRTPEMQAALERRTAALAALKELGFEPVRHSGVKLTTEQIEAMVACDLPDKEAPQ